MSNRATDLRPPYFMIEDAVVEKCALNPYEGWLYVVIVKHANHKTGEAFPGIARLAKLAGMSRRKVIECIQSLEKKGLIRVDRDTLPSKGERRERETNHYWILPATSSSAQDACASAQNALPVVHDGNNNQSHIEPESLTNMDAVKPRRAPRKVDPLYDAVSKVWHSEAGGYVGNILSMLRGTAKRGEWQRCNFDPPVSDAAEILAFGEYARRRMKSLPPPPPGHKAETVPTACVTIQRWFYDYRAEQEKKAARPAPIVEQVEVVPMLIQRKRQLEAAEQAAT